MDALRTWVDAAPLAVFGLVVMVLMGLAAAAGVALRKRKDRQASGVDDHQEGQEGYIVSAVLGLLALLIGFTFALAVERFETRRTLVLEEANAIGTTYLRTQLLEEPHRARISRMLVAYVDNRLALAQAPIGKRARLLAENDRLLTELWAATSSAFLTIKGLDFSTSYVETMNNLIDLDAARKAARGARVPTEVFLVLIVYMTVTALVLGYVLVGPLGKGASAFLLALLAMSLLLIVDIDRPTAGGIRESQAPMEQLRQSLRRQPPPVFDHWRIEDARRAPAAAR